MIAKLTEKSLKTYQKGGKFNFILNDALLVFFSILLTHEGSHREVYRDFQPTLTSSAGGAKGYQTTGSVHPQPTLPNC